MGELSICPSLIRDTTVDSIASGVAESALERLANLRQLVSLPRAIGQLEFASPQTSELSLPGPQEKTLADIHAHLRLRTLYTLSYPDKLQNTR